MRPRFKIFDRVWIDDGCKFGKVLGRAEVVDEEAREWHYEYFVKIGNAEPVWMHEKDMEAIKK